MRIQLFFSQKRVPSYLWGFFRKIFEKLRTLEKSQALIKQDCFFENESFHFFEILPNRNGKDANYASASRPSCFSSCLQGFFLFSVSKTFLLPWVFLHWIIFSLFCLNFSRFFRYNPSFWRIFHFLWTFLYWRGFEISHAYGSPASVSHHVTTGQNYTEGEQIQLDFFFRVLHNFRQF